MSRKLFTLLLISFVFTTVLVVRFLFFTNDFSIPGAPPFGEAEEHILTSRELSWLENWQRPEGPPKVGLQAGHWRNDEVPEELEKLKVSAGSSGGGQSEWEVNLKIAEETAEILEQRGVKVDILPATVPPSYWADVFIAIHADGSTDSSKSGFKIVEPWRDFTEKASNLVALIEDSYQKMTDLAQDTNISRNMRGYYAFSWWRYEHTIHPMTTAVIIETGFLTNSSDRRLFINEPELPAQGIANGLIKHLEKEGLLPG